MLKPRGCLFISWSSSISKPIELINSFNLSLAVLKSAFSLPLSIISIFTLFSLFRNFSTCLTLNWRSWLPARGLTLTLFVSVCFCFVFCSLSFLLCWYWYLPKSIIRQTGGLALGAISIRSSPFSLASSSAFGVSTTPRFSPFSSISRTGLILIHWLVLTLGFLFFL